MKILYIGDIMGERGVDVVRQVLPKLRDESSIDLVIAQGENVTDGRGLSVDDFHRLRELGIDFLTGGNWTLFRPELNQLLDDTEQPVLRPANYPAGTPGAEAKYIDTKRGKILVISLMGKIVGKDSEKPMENPLACVDRILEANAHSERIGTVVNFHGDYSSEKVVIGYYLDGQVSAVIGDHWHVPTADAQVLPKGTAHITDVGMCGALHSSLGVRLDTIVNRWRFGQVNRNELEIQGPLQFNAVLVTVDEDSGLAEAIQPVRRILSGK